MPLLKLETNVAVPDEEQPALLSSLSGMVAETIGKPETYVMVTLGRATIQMSGAPGNAAFVEIRSIGGMTTDVNRNLSEKICAILQSRLGIPPERVYLNFADVPRTSWGWDSGTFG